MRDPSDRRRNIVAPLTPDQQELVEAELARGWVRPEVCSLAAPWLVRAVGWDDLHQTGEVAVAEAAMTFDPVARPGVPFGAYARQLVRWRLWSLRRVLAKSYRAWYGMPTDAEGWQPDPADHRPDCPDPALWLWCSPDYSAQRRCLDWRSRVLLYLRTVEGMTLREVADALGVSAQRANQIEDKAVGKLAAFRNRRQIARQLAGRSAP